MFIVCLYVCVFVGMYLSNLSPLEGLEYLAAFFCLGHYHSLLLILNLKVCSLVGKQFRTIIFLGGIKPFQSSIVTGALENRSKAASRDINLQEYFLPHHTSSDQFFGKFRIQPNVHQKKSETPTKLATILFITSFIISSLLDL